MPTAPAVTITQTYPNEFQRAGITAPDADASTVPVFGLFPGRGFRLGATCNQPNATLALRLCLLDSNGRIISVEAVSYTTGAVPDWGAGYLGSPSPASWWPTLGARGLAAKVDSVTPGSTWSIAGAWGDQ